MKIKKYMQRRTGWGWFNASVLFVVLGIISGCEKPSDDPFDRYQVLPNGDVMHYRQRGNEEGKTVLMVHGWPTSALEYEPIMDELCGSESADFNCIAISLIGFGKSSCPDDGSMVNPVYESLRVEEFIRAKNLSNFALVVHDWGGVIGTSAAMRHSESVSHLVILNTFFEFEEGGLLEVMTTVLGPWFANSLITKAFSPAMVSVVMQVGTYSWLNFAERQAYQSPYDGKNRACKTEAGLNLFANGHQPQSKELYQELANNLKGNWQEKPTLFLWGENDFVLGPSSLFGDDAHAYINELIPQMETTLIPDAGHYLQEDQPELISAHIRGFLN